MLKQLLYLNDWELSAYRQEGGVLKRLAVFQEGYSGNQACASYLAASSAVPAYLLADLSEEDFQHEVLPHVSGPAQRALTTRRLLQYFRDTPYRRASLQGREQSGRKDDRILFSALTKPALPKSWLGAVSQSEVPLVGLYSLALLSEQLHKALRLPADALLLMTHQSSGLRQSYFQQGRLVFSRLTPLLNGHPDLFGEALTQEIGKTREFLASTRKLPREDRLDVAILSNSAMLEPLRTRCRDSDYQRYHLLTLDDAAAKLGLKLAEPAQVCDPLFLGLLAARTPQAHYPTPEQTRLYSLWRTRFALQALSAVAVACAFAWTGLNAVWGWEQYQSIVALGTDTRAANIEYRAVLRNTPPSDVSGHDMGIAVGMGKLMQQNSADPGLLLKLLSKALARSPQVNVERLHWQTQRPGSGMSSTALTGPRPDGVLPAALVGLPGKADQVLTVEGRIAPFHGDFRRALKEVQAFAAALERPPQYRVQIVQLPLDVTPGARLEGRADDSLAHLGAGFTLKLIWTH